MLWLWCRPEAVAPMGPLAWEPPCDTGVALKKQNNKIKSGFFRSSCRGTVVNNLTGNHEVVGSVPGLAQWVKDPALS